jgi:hypothetical protein
MKSYDPSGFSLLVTEDYTWRVREISDLKQVIRLSGESYGSVARKAALALVYAHWEGYVLFVASAYLSYIAKRKLRFSTLMPSLQAVHLTGRVQEWQSRRDTIGLRLNIIQTIKAMEQDQFRRVPDDAVNTGGNLNFDRFSDICQVMMIDATKIVLDREFLDDEIVGVRNRIAHGYYIVVTNERPLRASDYVLSLMRTFRTDIENCIIGKKYTKEG